MTFDTNDSTPIGSVIPNEEDHNFSRDEAGFIRELASHYSCDMFTAEEKVQHMIQLCPSARQTSKENIYSWIEENWNNYQLISF